MTSWQARTMKAYMRFDRWRNPPAEKLDVAQSRAWFETNVSRIAPRLEVRVESLEAGGVPVEWIEPPGASADRVVFYVHGGAYCVGSASAYRGLAGSIAQAAGARALVVDYRLAPEHPFPAAIEDVETAYHWLVGEGVSPEQVALAGDSAGGGLLLALLASLRDAGQPLPVAAACLSPWTDLAFSGASWRTHARRELVLNRTTMGQMAHAYLGDADPKTFRASPHYAEVEGFPPLLIQVGSEEVLLSDAQALAEKAEAAGVPVDLVVWEGMYHVWHLGSRTVPEARRAIKRIGDWLQHRWAEVGDHAA